jgi:hypothetical protein
MNRTAHPSPRARHGGVGVGLRGIVLAVASGVWFAGIGAF